MSADHRQHNWALIVDEGDLNRGIPRFLIESPLLSTNLTGGLTELVRGTKGPGKVIQSIQSLLRAIHGRLVPVGEQGEIDGAEGVGDVTF